MVRTFLLLLLFTSERALALSCLMSGFEAWPPSGRLPANAQVIFGAPSPPSSLLHELREDQVYLQSEEGDVIPLEFVDRIDGRSRYFILRPKDQPEPTRGYHLWFEGGIAANDQRPRRVAGPWWFDLPVDLVPPVPQGLPVLIAARHQEIIGESTSAVFSFPANEPVAILLSVSPVAAYAQHWVRMILWAPDHLVLYRGSCGSNFALSPETPYLALFKVVDTAGNVGGGPAHRLEFAVPRR